MLLFCFEKTSITGCPLFMKMHCWIKDRLGFPGPSSSYHWRDRANYASDCQKTVCVNSSTGSYEWSVMFFCRFCSLWILKNKCSWVWEFYSKTADAAVCQMFVGVQCLVRKVLKEFGRFNTVPWMMFVWQSYMSSHYVDVVADKVSINLVSELMFTKLQGCTEQTGNAFASKL